jgi:hypothetical protein
VVGRKGPFISILNAETAQLRYQNRPESHRNRNLGNFTFRDEFAVDSLLQRGVCEPSERREKGRGWAALSLVSIDVGKLVVSSIIVKGPPGPLLTRFFLRPDYHVQNYRDAAGGSRAAIVLPEEVRGPIADPVLDRLRRAGSSRPPHSPGRVTGPSGRRAAHTGRFWKISARAIGF